MTLFSAGHRREPARRPAPDPSAQAVPAIEPEEARRSAVEAGLIVHCAHPLNCETPLQDLIGGVAMPNARFYLRNHFHIPRLHAATWRLSVAGEVERPLRLGLDELRRMPSQTEVVTLECAGNGRSRFSPPIAGEQWRLGAVSTAEWSGVSLIELLDRCGVSPSARQIVFRGADTGLVAGRQGPISFERTLTVEEARNSGALLAYEMNGEALPHVHGHPLRLIVPGWYAMASVKWLTEIELLETGLDAHFQSSAYVYEYARDGRTIREPVRLQNVRSLITEPVGGREFGTGEVTLRGVAWSGAAPIEKVEVSSNGGPWRPARLLGDAPPNAWRRWELPVRLDEPGLATLRVCATDRAGHTQPAEAEWNRGGYGNNAIQQVAVRVR